MKDELKKYNLKRNFTKTKEPIGKKTVKHKKLRFVVQHHIARKDHYDFRLEMDGVLKSWAVPKGPSYNRKDKRLAVRVEDHPYSYRNFEGVIPKGEYGAGPVMIWDEGYYELEEKYSDFKKGPLKFTLYGERLKGRWTLIPFKENNWLLLKEKDDYHEFKNITKLDTSVKTGRTMEEIILHKKITKKDQDGLENIKITHPEKVMYKKPIITKKDILVYYDLVADRMLPYIENRIISVIRCPNGTEGNQFFKKHLETKGLGKVILKNDKEHKDDYYYIKDKMGLLNEAQMNTIEFHMWGSTVKKLEIPDIMVFDLDPDEKMNIDKVREGVKDLKKVLDEYDLKSYLKTSGGKGYHVVVPFQNKTNWKNFRLIAKNIAKLMEARWPEKYTSNMRKNKRKNKIFIDWVRNTRGSTFVAPYSLRARENAPISCPIRWNELDTIKPNSITMRNMKDILKKKDPWINFFE